MNPSSIATVNGSVVAADGVIATVGFDMGRLRIFTKHLDGGWDLFTMVVGLCWQKIGNKRIKKIKKVFQRKG